MSADKPEPVAEPPSRPLANVRSWKGDAIRAGAWRNKLPTPEPPDPWPGLERQEGTEPVGPAEAAAVLRRILAAVEKGELTGSATMIARLEGAVLALETLNSSEE